LSYSPGEVNRSRAAPRRRGRRPPDRLSGDGRIRSPGDGRIRSPAMAGSVGYWSLRTSAGWRMIATMRGVRQQGSAAKARRLVVMVAYDGVQSLDVTGPLEVFAGAQRLLEAKGASDR